MRVRQSMRGLIVDEGRLSGLLVDEVGRQLGDEPAAPTPTPSLGLLLPMVEAGAAYYAVKNGYKKTGFVLGAFAALDFVNRLGLLPQG